MARYCHFPYGKCGLKYINADVVEINLKSLPLREVWIEIYFSH